MAMRVESKKQEVADFHNKAQQERDLAASLDQKRIVYEQSGDQQNATFTQQEIQKHLDQASRFESQAAGYEAELAMLTQRVHEYDKRLEGKQNELDTAMSQLQSAQGRVESLQRDIADIKAKENDLL